MNKTAIVTGASSGIGRAIAERLLKLDYHVIGIGRTITENTIGHPEFTPIVCDLSQTNDVIALWPQLQADNAISLLVNAAGFGRFEPHEELTPETIEQMVAVNLTAPMTLTNQLLRTLKANQGTIINITSIEALRSSKFSALYSATKSGLRAFGQALFEEVRKSGVNVVTINPDMTDTGFFNELRFGVHESEDAKLLAEDIADAVEQILNSRSGMAITEMTIRSQRFGISKKS
ncbi:MAG: SDR family NAD(P)-dependent oxidoreductase [Campylobacterota bacterium]|nr:SDR family NAD(P)-dependent oxidoreductase [Campylobacterota bacterium]